MARLSQQQIDEIKEALDTSGEPPPWLKDALCPEAADARRQKLEGLSVLAGGVAHDFNNLLMGVLGHADLAMRSLPRDVPARAQLGKIVAAARRSAELCQQLLAYSGRSNFDVEPLELVELLKEIEGQLRATLEPTTTLELKLPGALPMVAAEGEALSQALQNLLTNASEALEGQPGRITLRASEQTLAEGELSLGVPGDRLKPGRYVVLTISDEGRGMDEATMGRCFDPFFSTKIKGRGLGLSVAQGIIRGHSGGIGIESTPGEGTTVSIAIPVQEQLTERPEVAPETEGGWRGSGTVLVVDDEPNARRIAQLFLEEVGFDVIVAEDGHQAIEIYQLKADQIVAVVLDLTMPKMSGEETFRRLRQVREDTPVILSSGYSEQEVTRRFAGQPWAGFIQKPYRFAALVQKLKALL